MQSCDTETNYPEITLGEHYQVIGFPGGTMVKNLPVHARRHRDVSSVHRSGRSPGGGNGNPSQYSCLGNPMDWRAW